MHVVLLDSVGLSSQIYKWGIDPAIAPGYDAYC